MIKIWLRRIHCMLALTCALFLLSLSISGSLLLYAKDIQAFLNPEFWQVKFDESQPKPLTLSKLIEKIELAPNVKIKLIEHAENPNHVWSVRLTNNKYLNINPYTGEVVLEHSFYDTFYGFVMSWHRWLVYKTQAKETPLKVWMSIASLALIIELLLGFYLWAKPKKRLKRLKIKWRSKPKILFYQLHTVVGVFSCIPLILIAFSGMAFQWQATTKQIVELLTFSKVETANYQHIPTKNKDYLNLDKAYKSAKSALPEGIIYRSYLPLNDKEPLKLRIKMPNESHAYSWSWADASTGKHLASFDASKASLATQVWNFKYKFHIGEFIGEPIKLLWLLLSLLPSFFVVSGIYLVVKRWQKK